MEINIKILWHNTAQYKAWGITVCIPVRFLASSIVSQGSAILTGETLPTTTENATKTSK